MATKVMYITARIEYDTDGKHSIEDIFGDLEYDFGIDLDGVEILDTELTDYEIVE